MSGDGVMTGNDGGRDGPAPLRLFISYSRGDQAAALPVIKALEQQGYSVWWDGLLVGGDNFLPTTQAALENADAVVVLWSKVAVDSHWVRDEATVARDRRRLVPLTIDGSLPPLGFRQFQVIDLSGWSGKADAPEFRRIISGIAAVAGAAPPAAPLATAALAAPASPPRPNRRAVLAGGLGVVAAGAGAAAWRWLRPAGAAASQNSIAVLPFRNLSGNAAQDYFAEGLAEELRTTLSLNRQLLVSGAASAGGFRAADADTRRIATALGVSNLLLGTVRQTGDRVRITARLVDGSTGLDRWAKSFDQQMADVLAAQARLATTVADSLISSLEEDNGWSGQRPGGTSDTGAFDAYVKGQALYGSDYPAALKAFDAAIARDGRYGAALAARARTLGVMANIEASPARAATRRRDAMATARHAIEIAPTMAEGHAALGFLLLSQLEFEAARGPYQKSFELGLGNAPILASYAEFSAYTGDFGHADAAIERSVKLDPLNPAIFRSAGVVALLARRLEAARTAAQTALSLNPRIRVAHHTLGDVALLAGDYATARAQFAEEPDRLTQLRGLAIADAKLRGPAAGDAQMASLVREFGDGGLYQQVQVLAQWGQIEAALAALDRAVVARDSGLVLALKDPMLDPLRQQPRFQAVLAGLGLTRAD